MLTSGIAALALLCVEATGPACPPDDAPLIPAAFAKPSPLDCALPSEGCAAPTLEPVAAAGAGLAPVLDAPGLAVPLASVLGWGASAVSTVPAPDRWLHHAEETQWQAAALTWPEDIWSALAWTGTAAGEPRYRVVDFTATGLLDALASGGAAALGGGGGGIGLRQIMGGWLVLMATALGLVVLKRRLKRRKRSGYGSRSRRPGSNGRARSRSAALAPSPSPLRAAISEAKLPASARFATVEVAADPDEARPRSSSRRGHSRRRTHKRISYSSA